VPPKVWAAFLTFKQISKINYYPMGENSPNLVTLAESKDFGGHRCTRPAPTHKSAFVVRVHRWKDLAHFYLKHLFPNFS
jgi:hypothetical protein